MVAARGSHRRVGNELACHRRDEHLLVVDDIVIVQVFTIDGKFVAQTFIDRWCEAPHCGNGQTVASTAFSHDREQRFLYVASRSPARIWVLDRKTLQPLDSFGRPGVAPGEFYVLHHMNTDSKGNLYTTEVQDGKRAQKFVFMGLEKK